MPGIAVLTNPRSRQNRRHPRLAGQLAYMLGTKGEVAQPQTLPELVDAARRFRDAGVDVVAINGGDGTSHVVLTAFVKAYGDDPLPPVALLRGGTMNTVASGMGIRGAPGALLEKLIVRYHTGEPFPTTERSLMKVSGEEPQYGFLFGNGLIANFLEEYYEGAEPSPTKAAWLLARGIFSAVINGELIRRVMRPVELEVEADGERWPARSFLSVAAGTVDDIGLGFRPFFESVRHPGRMHAIGLACTPLGVVKALPSIWMARIPSDPDILQAIPHRLVMRSERPITYMVDGDFHQGGQSLEVTIGPRVRFVLG